MAKKSWFKPLSNARPRKRRAGQQLLAIELLETRLLLSAANNFVVAELTPPQMTGPQGDELPARPTFEWTSVPGATRYDLWVNNVTTGRSQILRETELTETHYRPASDLASGRYRVWVQAYHNDQATGWSERLDFSIAGLVTPDLTSPSRTTSSNPTFRWTESPQATSYELWVNNLTTGQPKVLHVNDITGNDFSADEKLAAGRYRGWVRAHSATQSSAWSTPLTFEVTSLATPELLGPSGEQGFQPEFSWNAVDGASHYELWVNQLGTGTSQVIHETQLVGTRFSSETSLPAGRYRVWIRAHNSTSSSSWSESRTFDVTSLTAPQLIGTRSDQDLRPEFVWNSVNGATHYELWVDHLETGKSQVIHESRLTQTVFQPDASLPPGRYRAWVRGHNETSSSRWSLPIDLKVARVAEPVLLAPGSEVQGQPVFSWSRVANAVSYELWVNNLTTGESAVSYQAGLTDTSYTPETALDSGKYRVWVRAHGNASRSQWSTPLDFSLNANHAPTLLLLDTSDRKLIEHSPGLEIGVLSAIDPDMSEEHVFSTNDQRLEIIGNRLKLRDDVELDFETDRQLDFTVTVTDQGGLTLTSQFSLMIFDQPEIAAGGTVQTYQADNTLIVLGTDKADQLFVYEAAGDIVIADNTRRDGTGEYGRHNRQGIELIELYAFGGDDLIHSRETSLPTRQYGGEGNDLLVAGDGNDHLYGEAGDDYLSGHGGKNNLIGGTGADSFSLTTGVDSTDQDNTARIENGDLVIFGSAADDSLIITETSSGNILVSHYLKTGVVRQKFSAADVTGRIRYYGNAGHDEFRNNTSISAYADGGSGDDYLQGGMADDLLLGSSGDDILVGHEGNDYLAGGMGNDTLSGSAQDDTLSGGDGNDDLTGGSGHDVLTGDDGADVLNGEDGDDTLRGGAGRDHLYGGADDDRLYGDQDADWLDGQSGLDSLYGGPGVDVIQNGSAREAGIDRDPNGMVLVTGTSRSDRVSVKIESDRLVIDAVFAEGSWLEENETARIAVASVPRIRFDGGADDDTFDNRTNLPSTVNAGSGDDTISGGSGDDTIFGQAGNDVIVGQAGHDLLFGGDGNDQLHGMEGNDTLMGNAGMDLIYGSSGNDRIYGNEGNDTLYGGSHNDWIDGGTGRDIIHGDFGLDARMGRFTSEGGDDTLSGGEGNDDIWGEGGDDRIDARAGDDRVSGGLGNDRIEREPVVTLPGSGVEFALSDMPELSLVDRQLINLEFGSYGKIEYDQETYLLGFMFKREFLDGQIRKLFPSTMLKDSKYEKIQFHGVRLKSIDKDGLHIRFSVRRERFESIPFTDRVWKLSETNVSAEAVIKFSINAQGTLEMSRPKVRNVQVSTSGIGPEQIIDFTVDAMSQIATLGQHRVQLHQTFASFAVLAFNVDDGLVPEYSLPPAIVNFLNTLATYGVPLKKVTFDSEGMGIIFSLEKFQK